jgi:hypothetical protein
MTRFGWFGVCCVAMAACTSAPLAPVEQEIVRDEALGRVIERDTTSPVQTDSLVYHLTGEDPWYSVEIPFKYRNDTGRRIYIVNCHGGLNISLERRVGNVWEMFYQPVLLMCLSPPITMEPGAVYANAARIVGAVPGFNAGPTFASVDLEGEYRLVWDNLVHDYRDSGQGFGEPVGPFRSNPFLLVAPGGD